LVVHSNELTSISNPLTKTLNLSLLQAQLSSPFQDSSPQTVTLEECDSLQLTIFLLSGIHIPQQLTRLLTYRRMDYTANLVIKLTWKNVQLWTNKTSTATLIGAKSLSVTSCAISLCSVDAFDDVVNCGDI